MLIKMLKYGEQVKVKINFYKKYLNQFLEKKKKFHLAS